MPRQGGALVVILPCILLLELIVAGALAIASVQTSDSGIRTRQLEARISAESAVRNALGQIPDLLADSLTPGQRITVTLPAHETATLRSTAALVALEGGRIAASAFSRLDDRPAGHAAAIVRILTADTLWALFRAGLHTDGDVEVADAGIIASTSASPSATTTSPVCPARAVRAAERAVATIGPGILLPAGRTATLAPLATISGSPPIQHALDAARTRSATLPIAHVLAALADHSMPGATVTPRPSSLAGHCVILDPINWGDPTGLTACATHRPLIHIDGDLHILGGTGQGFLVVHGNVRIDGEARFDGAILATGDVTVDAAVITGAIRSLGTGTSRIGGTMTRDICPIWQALSAPAPRQAFLRSDRMWLPMH